MAITPFDRLQYQTYPIHDAQIEYSSRPAIELISKTRGYGYLIDFTQMPIAN